MQERDGRMFVSMSLGGQREWDLVNKWRDWPQRAGREVHYNNSSESRLYTGNWVIQWWEFMEVL